jgi:hypothetical protein
VAKRSLMLVEPMATLDINSPGDEGQQVSPE